MLIIGLTGRKRSGKDTVADYLSANYGFVRVALADPIKELLLELDPYVDLREWEDEYEPSNHGADLVRLSELIDPDETLSIRDRYEPVKDVPEVRRLLQRHGVAARAFNEDIWLDACLNKIYAIFDANLHTPGVVISDVRFPNEARTVEAWFGGVVWRVVRDGLLSDDTHVSETALDEWAADATIDNGGSIADLHHEIERHLDVLRATGLELNKIRENA